MRSFAIRRLFFVVLSAALISAFTPSFHDARTIAQAQDGGLAVGPQYNTTHVYVAPDQMGAFVRSWTATFGGTATPVETLDVTPTPSLTRSQLILSPVGTLSVFGFLTPVPFPFGTERTGWLMRNFDQGVREATASGATVLVGPWNDPVGRDAIIQFPGGINTQLYWHTTAPSYPPLATVPENRVYLSPSAVDGFLRSYSRFTGGTIVSDQPRADAGEIGLAGQTFRRIELDSPFGKTLVLVTDGHLPYPFGRETTGYDVTRIDQTLAKAKAAGATVQSGPTAVNGRTSAVLAFTGGYLAEIHSSR
jgi:hypothetical protein